MKRRPPPLDKPVRRHRPLSQEERELWKSEMGEGQKSGNIFPSPLEGEGREGGMPVAMTTPHLHPLAVQGGRKSRELALPHLDKSTLTEIRRGGKAVGATLDLHGHTQATAYSALLRFVERAQAEGIRLALVITGRGRLSGGALRELLPRWLAESPLREHIISCDAAGPRHGGDGAWYVRIRKKA